MRHCPPPGGPLSYRRPSGGGAHDQPDERMIRRRAFLATTGAALLTAPFTVRAQTAGPDGKVVRIGSLRVGPPPTFIEPFRQGLRELGYVEGQGLTLEYGLAGTVAELPRIAASLVGLKDVAAAAGVSCKARG
jgi:putative ABC transport system substrate-binding protein